jgi:hypothetical protein
LGKGVTRRRLLFAIQYPDYLRLFGDALAALRQRDIDVVLAFDKPGKNEEALSRAAALAPVEFTAWAPGVWQPLYEEIGCVLDYLRFMTPEFAGKPYLRKRMDKYLPARFGRLRAMRGVPAVVVNAVHTAVRTLEAATPGDSGHVALLERVRPDAVIVSPVLLRGRGSAQQTQLIKTAQRMGIPTAIAVGSWDHLSSKGLLRVHPDRLLVWNGKQREEAIRYHRTDPSAIVVTGAYPWQRWFDMRPAVDREAFATNVGLPPGLPYLLYVGSSRGIAAPDAELAFVRDWLAALDASTDAAVRSAAVMIRPHPGNREHWLTAQFDTQRPVVVWPREARAVFMKDGDALAFYHSIHYSEAVVGINTSAMIEATIIGRPVFSIRYPGVAQTETVHFEYLTPAAGGSTVVAESFAEHAVQLATVLRDPASLNAAREAFLRGFIRPDNPAAKPLDCFADAVEKLIAMPRRRATVPIWLRPATMVARRVAGRLAASAPR